MKVFSRMVLVITFVVMLAACGKSTVKPDSVTPKSDNGAQGSKAESSSFIDLAKKEGKVVFYSSTSKSEMDPVINLFSNKYGIQVEYLQLRGNEMVERIKVESRTNKFTADIADSGPTTITALKKEGYFTTIKTDKADKILGTDSEGFYRGTLLNVYGILVNTKLVPEKDMPKTWKDLLDPKWKGKILSDDPRAAGGSSIVYSILMEHKDYGKMYLENLAKQNITITRQYLENEKALARGEYPIYIPALGDSLHRIKGAQVKWIAPDDLTPYLYLSHGILKDAPHPNAAKLLSDFIISEEAQKIIAETRIPANLDIEPAIPEMKIKNKNLVKPSDKQIENQNNYFQEFANIFK